MARFFFTQQLGRFTAVPQVETEARVLRAGLDAAFALNPRLRSYVLDDQGALRVNVTIFIDGRRCHDTARLDDPLLPASQVYVLQALSGG